MSYLALYRKYRPSTFSEMVGQKAVIQALQNQVKFGQLGHATCSVVQGEQVKLRQRRCSQGRLTVCIL